MENKITSVEKYIQQLPIERKNAIIKLKNIVLDNLPKGFHETIGYGMVAYVVPHSIYPNGYHCNPKLPLPFISIASQKNFIVLYHMGLYANNELMNWFANEYPKFCSQKLDMGKSCIRFKKLDSIPYQLIGELMTKMSVEEWIKTYEKSFLKK